MLVELKEALQALTGLVASGAPEEERIFDYCYSINQIGYCYCKFCFFVCNILFRYCNICIVLISVLCILGIKLDILMKEIFLCFLSIKMYVWILLRDLQLFSVTVIDYY